MNLKKEDLQNIETIKNLAKSNNLNFISAKCPECKYQLLSIKVDVITLYDKLLIENLLSSGWYISLEDKMIDVSTRNKNDCCPDLGIAKLFNKNLEDTKIDDISENESYIDKVTNEEILRISYITGRNYIGIVDFTGEVIKSEEIDPDNLKTYKKWIKNYPDSRLKLIK